MCLGVWAFVGGPLCWNHVEIYVRLTSADRLGYNRVRAELTDTKPNIETSQAKPQ